MKMFKSILMSSLLAVATLFAACGEKGPVGGDDNGNDNGGGNTDPSKPLKVNIEITTGTVTDNSAVFSVTTTNADKVLYWVHLTKDAITTGKLNMAEGTEIEAGEDIVVTINDLKSATGYKFYVYAENAEGSLFQTASITTLRPGEGPAAPKVSTEGDSVTADSIKFWAVFESGCEAGWYLVVPEGESVTAERVKSEGTAINASDVEYGEKLIEVTNLTPKTSYDVYVAAERSGVLGLSRVYKVRTQSVNLFTYFNAVKSYAPDSFEKDRFLITFSVVDPETQNPINDDTLSLQLADMQNKGYLDGTYTPISVEAITGEETSLFGFIPDGGYSNFIYKGVGYEFVMPEAGTESQYYVKIGGGMVTGIDNNKVDIRLPYKDTEGNLFVMEGTYNGPLNYSGNSGAQTAERNNLYMFNKMTSEWEGNTVTLFGSSITAGSITLVLNTPDGKIATPEESRFYCVEDNSLDAEKSNHTEYALGFDTMDWVFTFINGGMTFERLADTEDGKECYQITLPKSGNSLIQGNPKALKGMMLEPKQLIINYVNNDVERWIVVITPKGEEVEDDPTLS